MISSELLHPKRSLGKVGGAREHEDSASGQYVQVGDDPRERPITSVSVQRVFFSVESWLGEGGVVAAGIESVEVSENRRMRFELAHVVIGIFFLNRQAVENRDVYVAS